MTHELKMRDALTKALAVGALACALYLCVPGTTLSAKSAESWQRDMKSFAGALQVDEAFWKLPSAESSIEWTSQVWDVTTQKGVGGVEELCVWLEVPYTKKQTKAGLWPVPVQIVIPVASDLGAKVQQLNLVRGQTVRVKGLFKGFAYMGLVYAKDGSAKASGRANDIASAMMMMMKAADENPSERAAKAYGEAKGLPLGSTRDGRIILPSLEVRADELDIVK